MRKVVLLGIGRFMLPIPRFLFEQRLKHTEPVHLSEEAHRVRDFVVTELPTAGKSLSPAFIAESLDMPHQSVATILDTLEKGMTFLWRSDGENVTWAYPVTADTTPHRYTFNTGETGFAA
jgi:hypothetical protein